MDFDRVNEKIRVLIKLGITKPSIGVAVKAMPVKIADYNRHAKRHGVTLEEAQRFVDTAVIMLYQENGERYMYLSLDGSAIILVENNNCICSYGKNKFDPSIKAILEIIKNERE
ncbi:MAG: hypothetical protein LBN42_03330 [Oscillospiraceae bacterium]|jgi:hypothetical protein|nr:hypothetical protein [Oscillospiraceae bacterium]